jgi:hypothetical protein
MITAILKHATHRNQMLEHKLWFPYNTDQRFWMCYWRILLLTARPYDSLIRQ